MQHLLEGICLTEWKFRYKNKIKSLRTEFTKVFLVCLLLSKITLLK